MRGLKFHSVSGCSSVDLRFSHFLPFSGLFRIRLQFLLLFGGKWCLDVPLSMPSVYGITVGPEGLTTFPFC